MSKFCWGWNILGLTINNNKSKMTHANTILVTRALDRPKALGNSMQENMRRRVLIAKNRLLEPYGACSLLVLAWMHQLKTLLIVLHENQWEDTLFQGSPELFSRSVKRRALGSRLMLTPTWCGPHITHAHNHFTRSISGHGQLFWPFGPHQHGIANIPDRCF